MLINLIWERNLPALSIINLRIASMLSFVYVLD
jgi:hypothetical protein